MVILLYLVQVWLFSCLFERIMNDTYTQYDHLFHNVIPNAVGGIHIFSSHEEYLKPQDYAAITNLENSIWADLFRNLKPLLDQYAAREYILGLRSLPIPTDRFPKFDDISPLIENATGWKLEPVAGFLDEELFFDLNANRRFPVTDIIRRSPRFQEKYSGIDIQNDEGYTPEPDIFHDIQGHVPFLMNRGYSDFLAEIGSFGLALVRDEFDLGPAWVAHNLKRLQNFAWWTYEFGVLENTGESDGFRHKANDIDYEIYGSGILSSYDETLNVVECAKGTSVRSRFIPFDIEEVVLTRFDYSDIQDRYYVIPSLEVLYTAFRENRDIFLFHD